jgi:predicted dehydrogenase
LTPYSFESATGENPHLAIHNQPVYTIMGTSGTITFPNLDFWSYTSSKTNEAEEGDWTKHLSRNSREAIPFDKDHATDVGEKAPFTKRLQYWVAVIRGRESPDCALEDGLRNIFLLEAITSSIQKGVAIDV